MGDIYATDRVVKHSNDDCVYTFRCTNLLAAGEVITGTPTVTDTTTHATSSITISGIAANATEVTVDGKTTAIGKAVQCRISGGADSADHVLTCTFSTDDSNTKVTGGTLLVRDS